MSSLNDFYGRLTAGRVGREEWKEDHDEVDHNTETIACRACFGQKVAIVVLCMDRHTREN